MHVERIKDTQFTPHSLIHSGYVQLSLGTIRIPHTEYPRLFREYGPKRPIVGIEMGE